MLSIHFCLDDEENDRIETVDNYKDLFFEYTKNPPSLDEALDQLFESKGIDKNKINNYKKELINNCKTVYDKNCSEIKKIYPEIKEEDFNIICSYTCEIKEKEYSPYTILNQNLVSKNRKTGIENVTKYYYLLLTTLRKLRKKQYDNLYRAIRNILELKKGEIKTFWGFTSTSIEQKTTNIFLKNNGKEGTFYLLKNACGYDISLFNFYEEKEILLEPETQYEIEDILKFNETKINQIICKYIDSPVVLRNVININNDRNCRETIDDNKINNNGNHIDEEKDKNDKNRNKKNCNCIFFGILEILLLLAVLYLIYRLYHYFFDSKTIIGIDFGHSFSGFAVLESNDNKGFYFSESESKSEIVPTKIIIDRTEFSPITIPSKTLQINNLASENKLLFFNFKKNLDPRNYKENIESNLPLNRIVPLEKVIQAYFEKFKKNYIDENKKIKEKNLKEIKWVITIPPLYDEISKNLMKKIACKTLLNQNSCKDVGDQLKLALEPEAASLAIFYDAKIEKLFSKGKSFLLVDAGGFTVDFSLNEIIDGKNNLRQLTIPKSFVLGSNLINEKIVEIIELIFKKDKIDYIKNNYYSQWTKVLNEIEEIKKTIDQIESDNIKFSLKLDIDPKTCFKCWFQELWTNCLCNIEYNNVTFSYNKSFIFIPKFYIRNIIVDLAYNITKEIKNYCNENHINLIVITGGFSYNNILRQTIKKELRDYLNRNKLLFLDSPQETVMKGAAIYGLKPNQIKERILPITLGVKSCEKCNNEECCNYIQIFKMGETVITDKIKNVYNVYPKFDKIGSIEFYYSFSDNINENRKQLISIPLDYSIKKEKRTVYIKFSNYISINVYDQKEEDEWVKVDYP